MRKTRYERTMFISEDYDEEDIQVPMRNYLCRYYDKCLNNAARANKVFGCENCRRFKLADKQELSTSELSGMMALWESVFEARISLQ
jgi:hypothetical protein